jgi:transposase InsO family protein
MFRIMRQNGMLLARHTGRRNGRLHDGKVVVMGSNLRWCSDGFEIACWNGDLVRVSFIIDAHDREIIAWHAVANAGISGSMVRDMMLEAVETRFAAIQAPHPLEWLTDNGSVYTAKDTPTSHWRSISCPASLPFRARNRTASRRASSRRSSAIMFACTPCLMR